ncbi:MAG: YXWGXW repeat-containing protein [Sandaracinaceae bacterium]
MLQLRQTTLLLLIAAALGLSGCYGRARVAFRAQVPSTVTVTAAPPAVRPAATQPPKPGDDAVWVAGYYEWRAGAWVWVDGHWERDRAGYVWVAPVANDVGGRVEYHPGYWRPESAQPAPAYRSGGNVRVTAHTRTQGHVEPGPTVTARSPSQGRVEARSPSGGSVRASGGATVTARTPSGGAQTGGGATVTARTPSGSARTSGGATVTARGGTQGGTVHRADDTPARAEVTRPSERGATTARGSAVATRPHERGATTARGSAPATRPHERGATTARGSAPTTTPRTPPTVQRPTPSDNPGGTPRALSCQVDTPRAPEGGIVSITGVFSGQARVQIGGQFAPTVRRTQGEISVRVPGSSGGGMVRVLDEGRTANCGNMTVIGR